MAFTKKQFIEIYNSLPDEKKKYGLFYIDSKQGFCTWDFLWRIKDKEDKNSKEIKARFLAGKYWEKPSCISLPQGYKVEGFYGSRIVVSSEIKDVAELVKLVNTYTPTDRPWTFDSKDDIKFTLKRIYEGNNTR